MKWAFVIVACTLILASHAMSQSASPAEHILPAAEELGPGWVELSSTLPTGGPDYPEARGWYAGPDGSRIVLLVSVPPADSLDSIWEEIAQAVEADSPRVLFNAE